MYIQITVLLKRPPFRFHVTCREKGVERWKGVQKTEDRAWHCPFEAWLWVCTFATIAWASISNAHGMCVCVLGG